VEEKDAADADRRASQRIIRERKSEIVVLFRRKGDDGKSGSGREDDDLRDEPLLVDVLPTEAIFCGKRNASAATGLVVKNSIVDIAMMTNAKRTRDGLIVVEEQTPLYRFLSLSSNNISGAFCVFVVCIFYFFLQSRCHGCRLRKSFRICNPSFSGNRV
jgi:hypothetical protein